MNRPHSPWRNGHGRIRPQRGVTLIIALIMLVIIGLTSAAVMRNSLNADTVANNSRVQALASQAAQIALRHCERMLESNPRVIQVQAAKPAGTPGWWEESLDNWDGNAVEVVPESSMKSGDSTFAPAKLPDCMAEFHSTLAKTIIVTARGFSPDYAESEGRTTAGSVVWLQSILKVK